MRGFLFKEAFQLSGPAASVPVPLLYEAFLQQLTHRALPSDSRPAKAQRAAFSGLRQRGGDPGRTPTCDLGFRKALLYAAELRGHARLPKGGCGVREAPARRGRGMRRRRWFRLVVKSR